MKIVLSVAADLFSSNQMFYYNCMENGGSKTMLSGKGDGWYYYWQLIFSPGCSQNGMWFIYWTDSRWSDGGKCMLSGWYRFHARNDPHDSAKRWYVQS